jgi:hypothetical protein
MGQRLELQALLIDLLGSSNVYFQPPATVNMKYPCIVYNRIGVTIHFADDKPYKHKKRYQITIIDQNPDSEIPDKVAALPSCSFDRFFAIDNLNHDIYNLFF